MNRLDEQYRSLLAEVLYNGTEKNDRTGTGTLSRFGMSIRHRMKDGFPLLTTKRVRLGVIRTELMWFLKGDTNIEFLIKRGCNIWNGDAYKQYKRVWEYDLDEPLSQPEFATRICKDKNFSHVWGELGPIYGKQWRDWNGIDQIKNLIEQLKLNPNSRRLMVSAWNVGELIDMVLPPCHYGFQVYTRKLSLKERRKWCKDNGVVLEHLEAGLENEEDDMRACGVPTRAISLMWNQRSADLFLGVPFNIASYGMLLELIAKEVNMVSEELIGNFGDVHLYKNHLEQAKEQISRKPYPLPTVKLSEVNLLEGDFNVYLENYRFHPAIKAPLSN